MKPGLKQAVIDHLEQRRLSEDQLDRLYAVQQEFSGQDGSRTNSTWKLAAVLFAAVLLWISIPRAPIDLAERIANEAALNHLKKRPLEVYGVDLADVRPYFDELDFRLIETRMLAASDGQLLGGRYCSVQGEPAAQLEMHDASGRSQSLYQAPYLAARFGRLPMIAKGKAPREIYTRGVHTSLWVEKGLLFVLARQ